MLNLSLGTKIRIGFLAVIAVMVALSALVYANLSTINSQATLLRDEVFKFASITNNINDTSNLCAIAMLDYDGTGLKETWDRASQRNQEKNQHLQAAYQLAQSNEIFKIYRAPLQTVIGQSAELTKLIDATWQAQEALADVSQRLNDMVNAVFDNNTVYTKMQTDVMIKGGTSESLQYTAHNLALIKEADDLLYELHEGANQARRSGKVEVLQEVMGDVPEMFGKMDELISRTSVRDTETQDLLKQIRGGATEVEALLHEFADKFSARLKVEHERETLDISISGIVDKISTDTMAGLAQGVDNAVGMSRQSIVFLVVGLLIALVVGIIISVAIVRGILRPVKNALEMVERCADGNFAEHADPNLLRRGDELGQLLRDVENMSQKLAATISLVGQSAQNVNDAAMQIRQGNQEVSKRTQQQAGAIEETVSAVEEMTSSIRNNAQHSQQANQLVQQASQIANNGGEVLNRTISAMQEVSASSKKINEVTNVVNEIAFQTNLLALNASVEAARAGEAGRGFAVVASEVRNLAIRSANAARQIQELISDSVNKVEQGNQLMSETAKTLGAIIDHVGQVATVISEISASGQEQSVGIGEINRSVGQMDQGVQQNAALVEQTAAASTMMAQEAQDLMRQMSQFKVDTHSGTKRLPQP